MTICDQIALDELCEAFKDAKRGEMIGNPMHCAECEAANNFLNSLEASDVTLNDIGDRAGFDYFSMISDSGYIYFIPGLCRIALEENPEGISYLLQRLGRAHKVIKDANQKNAIIKFLNYLNEMHYVCDRFERKELHTVLKSLTLSGAPETGC